MSQPGNQFKLRLTDDLKARVVASAKANNRSINAEIAFQLGRAYDRAKKPSGEDGFLSELSAAIGKAREDIRMDSMAGNS